MNKQEVFDKVARHFIVEGNPSAINGRVCSYLTPEGSRCAIGIFFDDDTLADNKSSVSSIRCMMGYRTTLSENVDDGELNHIWSLAKSLREKFGYLNIDDITFLRDIQQAHDYSAPNLHLDAVAIETFKERMKNKLIMLAGGYKLNVNVLAT